MALGHAVAGRHFDKEVFSAVPLEGFEELEIVGQNHETAPVFFEGSKEIKGPVTVAVRDDPGEVGIPLGIFDQEKRAPFIGDKFTAHDGFDSRFLGGLDKKDQSIEAVGVGQSQPVHAVFFGGLAERFNGPDTPSFGEVGVDMEVNKGIHIHHRVTKGTYFFRLSGDADRRKEPPFETSNDWPLDPFSRDRDIEIKMS
jgi:hypothetical protein